MKYALKTKGRFEFLHVSKTPEELEQEINTAYWNWRGNQDRNAPESEKTVEKYLEKFDKVKLTIEPF